ncbi:Phosphatidylglycerol--prolipoprotein diacylglyceryl transferase [Dyadobacter sp. CECT 9275]|uniref:Phosphatidylglycerol--prolipoprotein diacylglyceryl transferase n=1 Tax=Dyadobacter helix TaxID=2822344 RepID=A0A916JCV6_9BACT|nr:prolipoprotein diacylglyceryl transferase [Dyadobacter sp. CECT 9275]CAG4992857.1 Phosphatidylglycerol--prolipoprotein diacylglyceryl transferase [Dyadobacter sp. CECT 9275]
MHASLITYILWDIRPNIFPGLEIPRWYGLFWALGITLSFAVIRYIYKADKRPVEEIDTLGLYVMIGTIVGARLGHILFYDPDYYLTHPIEILPISLEPELHFTGLAGLASHGGGIGVVLAIFFYSRNYGIRFLWLLDRVAIIAPLSGVLIRLGNLINSEMIGLPTTVPWAFVFVHTDHIPRHPAQLYEAIYCLILFVVLFWLWKNRSGKMAEGMLFSLFITLLFTLRFVDEFFKINQEEFENALPLNMGQLLSIPYIIAGLLMPLVIRKQKMPADKLPQY